MFTITSSIRASHAVLIARYHFALWSAKRSNYTQSLSTKRQRVIGDAAIPKPGHAMQAARARAVLIVRQHSVLLKNEVKVPCETEGRALTALPTNIPANESVPLPIKDLGRLRFCHTHWAFFLSDVASL
jgi:hypothetical protein